MRTILIEDSAAVRQSLKKMLAQLSDEVQVVGEAETSRAALALIEQTKPEVIILDFVLKDGSGFEVLRHAKDHEPPPLVIVLSNQSLPPFRKKAQEQGADLFFDKANELEMIVATLHEKFKARHAHELALAHNP
ncbi:response regulator transcription factor [candidate division KSB1 bacterium]|nr:response regulator transcription factor [candidate division KSB1 bacterium]